LWEENGKEDEEEGWDDSFACICGVGEMLAFEGWYE